MAKSPSKSAGGKASADRSAKSTPAAKPSKGAVGKGVSGNGKRAEQAQLDLSAEAVESAPEPKEVAAAVESAPAVPASLPPPFQELGLSGKGAWKIDLKGKRVSLDEKAWREELTRALGRAPVKA